MPTLMGLANEILTAIIEAIEPDDIESFSTCCKLIHSLARPRLEEHKKKKSLFSKLLVEDYFLPFPRQFRDTKYGKPGTYLKEFFSDERNRLYSNAMILNLFDGFGPMSGSLGARIFANNGLNDARHQLKCTMAEVHSTIGLEFGENEIKEWGKEVQAGYPIATFLFLLALLPNLEKITINSNDYWTPMLSANCLKISRLMIEAALGQEENGLSFGGKLSMCTIDGILHGETGGSLLPFIMMLPRMQKIRGYNLEIQDGSWPYTDAVSPVVDLDLEGAIYPHFLSSYIRGIRELKRFTYVRDNYTYWVPCDIVAALKQFAFRSLVYLNLTTDEQFEEGLLQSLPGIGSLRSFEVLETIRLQYVLLFEDVRTPDSAEESDLEEILGDLLDNSLIKGQKLIDFLPSSVRTFRVEDIAKGRLLLDMFDGLSEHVDEKLPNLELITLDAGKEINRQVEKICEESGVRLRLR